VRRATAFALLLVLASVAGCGSDSSRNDAAARARAAARQQALHARLVTAGRSVFAKHCALCHTMEGRVAHPTFIESTIPNLDEVRPEAAYVHERVRVGGFDMPSFERELSSREFDAVVAYVVDMAGRRVAEPQADAHQLALGRAVFDQHCQACHGIGGRRPTTRPQFPGTDFNLVKPSEEFVIRQALRGIEGSMPSFRGKLTRAQLQAVAAYVTATAGS